MSFTELSTLPQANRRTYRSQNIFIAYAKVHSLNIWHMPPFPKSFKQKNSIVIYLCSGIFDYQKRGFVSDTEKSAHFLMMSLMRAIEASTWKDL